ncbi:MAG TPA: FAD-binding oxidoreductase [Gemmatimonadaceae bacterium]
MTITRPSGFRGIFRVDDVARAVYSEGAGIARIIPRAIAVPVDATDAMTLVSWARDTVTPLIARGSGSGMAGAAIGDGVIVDLSRMRDISQVDLKSRTIPVGPGVTWQEVESAARACDLRFPPDPSSGAFCSIGGMVSTNASGSHSLKYGVTRSWVQALDCIFEDGTRATVRRGAPAPTNIAALGRFQKIADELIAAETDSPSVHPGVRKDSSGYGLHAFADSRDVIDILIGSEGTLAIVVGIELRLADAPRATSSLLGCFPTLESAVKAAVRARDAGAAACELLDRTFLDVAGSASPLPNVPKDSDAVLLAEVEANTAGAAREAARTLADDFRASGATYVELALTPVEEKKMWELRHAASPILNRLGPSLTSMQFVEDCAVPPDRLPEYVRGVRAILQKHNVTGVIFGHAGDSHIHVNPLIDVNRSGWREVVETMLGEVVALTASLGGTLDGEHGDGRLRTPLLHQIWGADIINRYAIIKHAFDPAGILNPGVKVPIAGETAICDIKYDPSLPALPQAAADALKVVTDQRAYSRFRLDMLNAST